MLRQQLIVLRRCTKRPKIRRHERGVMVALAGVTRTWGNAMLLAKPATILRWHREGFRLFRKRKSRAAATSPRLDAGTVAMIKRLAVDNRLWGSERIRGELLKLGLHVSKRTIHRYMRVARGPQPWGQSWSTFSKNHASQIWACDFLQTHDIFFRPIFAFFIAELGSREVVQVAVTRAPTSRWVARQLRQVTPLGSAPRFIIRDNDDKFGVDFDRVAKTTGIRVLRTPVRAPKANAVCERYLGSVRRECLDHVIVVGERHLHLVLREYVAYFNTGRPHQGIEQRIPAGRSGARLDEHWNAGVVALPILGGLHHQYRWAA